MNDKIRLHSAHNTDLIYTFSSYNDERDLLEHLQEALVKHGFELRPRSSKEVFDKIVNTEENRYIIRLVKLVCTFIQNFKTNGYRPEDFNNFRNKTKNVRSRLFLTVCEQCYYEYAKCLKEKNAVDFEDMINGNSDAVVCDSVIASDYVLANDNYREMLAVTGTASDTVEDIAIAVEKGNSELLDLINSAVDTLRESGQLEELYAKWNLI